MPSSYERTSADDAVRDLREEERQEKIRKATARKERELQRAQSDAESKEHLWRRLSVLGVLAALSFIVLIVATSIWCYLGRYFHESRGGETAWLTILWVILLGASLFAAVKSVDQWVRTRQERITATRAYQDFLADGDEVLPSAETLDNAVRRILKRDYGYPLSKGGRY